MNGGQPEEIFLWGYKEHGVNQSQVIKTVGTTFPLGLVSSMGVEQRLMRGCQLDSFVPEKTVAAPVFVSVALFGY